MYAESCYFLRVFYGFTVHGMHAKTWMIKLLTYFWKIQPWNHPNLLNYYKPLNCNVTKLGNSEGWIFFIIKLLNIKGMILGIQIIKCIRSYRMIQFEKTHRVHSGWPDSMLEAHKSSIALLVIRTWFFAFCEDFLKSFRHLKSA